MFLITTFSFWKYRPAEQALWRLETKIDNVQLQAILIADPSQTTSELPAGGSVSDKFVLIHLKQIGKVRKLDRYLMN